MTCTEKHITDALTLPQRRTDDAEAHYLESEARHGPVHWDIVRLSHSVYYTDSWVFGPPHPKA